MLRVAMLPKIAITAVICNDIIIALSCKDSPYSITERWVPELITVFRRQPAGDVNHKPGGIGCH